MVCPQCHSEIAADSAGCQRCGTATRAVEQPFLGPIKSDQAARRDLLPGTLFASRYEIIELLGQGGMGQVFKAYDREVKDTVALKLLRPEIAAHATMIERFRNETKLARAISHRNVCRMYDLGKVDGDYYLAMEYVAGHDLKALLQESGPLALDEVLRLGRQIAEGLAEAHRLGVVHRDLKPQNVMVDQDGNARIMDFGIARATTGECVTRSGVIIGTPDYMSPEQWVGKAADRRSDIYALGAMLYEMATGRKPFAGETPFVIGLQHRTEMPKDPRADNPAIPEALSKLILACLEKEPAQRPQTTEAVVSRLACLERTTGAAAAEPVFVASAGMPMTPGTGSRSVAVLPFADLSAEKDQDYFCEGIAEELIHSLAKIRDLRVAARTSAFSFKGHNSDIREIGRKLNVDTILEGSVRKAGDRLRITAQLINVADGYHLWSDRYDRQLRDIFALQDEVARAIIEHFKLSLLPQEQQAVFERGTNDLEAHALYLEGLHYLWDHPGRGFGEAIGCFERGRFRRRARLCIEWGFRPLDRRVPGGAQNHPRLLRAPVLPRAVLLCARPV